MAKKERFQANDFSGGMDAKTAPALLEPNRCVKIVNGDLDRIIGSISRRRGYEAEGDVMFPASDVLGLGSLAKADGTHRIVAVCGLDAYVYNPVTEAWTAQGQALTDGYKAEFRTFLNQLYMCNYSNDLRRFDDTNWNTEATAARSKYLEVYLNRLYMGNCVVQPNSYPSRVYFSSLPTDGAVTYNTTENTGDYLEIDTDDNDVVRGLAVNSNRLLIFKEYSLHTWDGYARVKLQGQPGTTSHRSIVNIDDWTYYFNRDGVFRWNGGVLEYISDPVKPYIDGISAATAYGVCGGRKDRRYVLYLGDVKNTQEGIEEQRVLLELNTTNMAWKVHLLQTRPTVFLSCPTGGF